MAASSPLHSDGSASRQPSSHSLHGITASNAALPSRKVEGLLDHLRPWSGSRSCGGPPRPRPLPFAHASHADARTKRKTTACARAVRVRCCRRVAAEAFTGLLKSCRKVSSHRAVPPRRSTFSFRPRAPVHTDGASRGTSVRPNGARITQDLGSPGGTQCCSWLASGTTDSERR